MKFAVNKRVITPRFSFVQQGFAARRDPWTKVHDDLYARAAVLAENTVTALISLDLISGDRSFEKEVSGALSEEFGIPPDHVVLSYTHTHGALGIGSYGGEESAGYRAFILGTITDLVREGLEGMREAKMSLCRASSDFGVSRRYPSPEGILWKPNFDPEAADRDLYLLKFEDKDGVRGIFWNYACHPTSCGPSNLEITADYPGAVAHILETEFPGSCAMFLQGCGADIKPVISASEGSFVSLTAEQMALGSRRMADDLLRALRSGGWKEISGDITARSEEIMLPCTHWDRSAWEEIAYGENQPEYRKKAALRALEKYDRGELTPGLPFVLKCVRLSAGVRMICLENEMVNAYGRRIKERIAGDTITLGYTGRVCGYIPTAQILREGGYESESFLGAGTAGPFAEGLEEAILSAAVRLAERTEEET